MSARRLVHAHNPLSFLELALVVAVVGVAAAVAVPEYLQLRQDASDDSARSRLTGAAQTLETQHRADGTFAGASLPAGVRLHASRVSYCIETNAGGRVWHAARHAQPATGRC
jgi:Tfp pilus assembly protein PilE